MPDFLEGEDLELWNIFQKGPKISMAMDDRDNSTGPKKYSKECHGPKFH